ncbi:MAG: hypothetical protein KDK70_37895 [Myxococcales bacterium]|nr:hypothetical protein [Myxococcales bacterium]
MSEQTQRWMRRELDELLAQRARYVLAERTSRSVHQKVQHTRHRLRLDQEILGRREALRALEQQHAEVANRDPGLGRPRLAAAGPATTAKAPLRDRTTLPLALGVCVATFALGFVLVGNHVATDRQATASSPSVTQPLRYRPLNSATPVHVPQRQGDPVMAAGVRTKHAR